MKSVVVLGMHRSGTSAIAKALSVLGVNLGKNLLPPKEDNKKGFWEDFNIVDFNTNLMKKQSHDWYTFGPIEQGCSEEHYDNVLKYVEKEFGGSTVWGFKDPRTCRLIPFWDSILNRMNSEVVYCIVVRNPLSVIKSLEKRDGFSAKQASLLWYQYNMDIIAGLADKPFTVIDYDSLLIEPEENLVRLANGIGQADALTDFVIKDYCNDFLSGGLRNSKFTLGSLDSNCFIPEKVAQLYRELLSLTGKPNVYLSPTLKNYARLWKEGQSSNIDVYDLLNDILKLSASESAQLLHCNSRLDIALSHVEYLLKERDHVINEREIMARRHQMAVASLDEARNKEKLAIETNNRIQDELENIYSSMSWKFTRPLRYIVKKLKY